MIWSQTNYVLEGEAFLPKLVCELLDSHPDKVKAAFMGYAEVDLAKKIKEVKDHSSGIGDWLIDEPEDYIASHIKNMIDYSAMIKSECSLSTILPYFDTSNDFNDSIERVLNYLAC